MTVLEAPSEGHIRTRPGLDRSSRAPRLGALLLATAASAALASPAAAQTGEGRTLEVDDLFELLGVGDPRISPDGDWVAYTVTTTSLEDEQSVTRVWMIPFEGGTALPMTREAVSARAPRWSPDGRLLSFLSSSGGGSDDVDDYDDAQTQVWALDRRGGEARPLTDVEQGVSAYAWSPDGTRLALTIRDGEEEHEGETEPPWVIDRLQFKRDRRGYLDRRRTHVYVFDLEAGELTQLTDGDFDDSAPAWSPDGRWIAFVSNRTDDPDANDNDDIWLVAADATVDAGLRQVTTSPGADGAPSWSPDGRWITHTTVTEPELIWYATEHLAITAVEGAQTRVLTLDLDRNVSPPRFSRDGSQSYTRLEDSAEDHLVRVAVADGTVQRDVDGPVSIRAFDLGPDDRRVLLMGSLLRPDEVFAAEAEAPGLRQLSAVNDAWLSELRLGSVQGFTFESADGTEVEGFLFLPPDYQEGQRYPTLLRIHGGPVSQYRHRFYFDQHLFAARGYAVVITNPRGSSGYGQDFSAELWADWGNKDFQDVMAGVDWAVDHGYADPDRLGVGGWSYGGILTNYVITQTDRFKGAVTGASEVLYAANYGHDHYQREWEAELGLPWENREAWERISPFNKVQNITTPTLIMGGEKDWNVPILNSEQLYQALKRRGVETLLVVYPGQSHGIRRPSYQKDRLERYLDWYDRFVTNAGAEPVTQEEGSP